MQLFTCKTPMADNINFFSVGRKGDARMHKAVAAKSQNPRLSLFEALLIGGFSYTMDDPNILDNENVSLAQRKNQLSRRLRTARRQSDPSPASIINLGAQQQQPSQEDLFALALGSTHSASTIASATSPVTLYSSEDSRPKVANSAPSSVAIMSLGKTAASVGMTLDQLAKALSNKNALSRVLSPEMDQKELALNFYTAEVKSLYTKAMLVANYPPQVAHNPQSREYQQFAGEAWKREGQRLMELMDHNKPSADAAVAPPLSNPTGPDFEPIHVLNHRRPANGSH